MKEQKRLADLENKVDELARDDKVDEVLGDVKVEEVLLENKDNEVDELNEVILSTL